MNETTNLGFVEKAVDALLVLGMAGSVLLFAYVFVRVFVVVLHPL